jgi:uncharacterized protein (DUF1499 family)
MPRSTRAAAPEIRFAPKLAQLLRAAMAKVIASEPMITVVDKDDSALTEQYLQRSALLGFPDTINVRYFVLADGRSTLALYSRSQLGRSDLGVNKARLKRWMEELQKALPMVQ